LITLHQFQPAFGLPNASPFCMKLETWLRMAKLPYVAPLMHLSTLGKAPKGKLPYIVDGKKTVADTAFIIEYLKATYGDPLDDWLSTEQKTVSLAFQRLMARRGIRNSKPIANACAASITPESAGQ
jgi:glutathione S-transferase